MWRSLELDPGAPASREGRYGDLLAAKHRTSPAGGAHADRVRADEAEAARREVTAAPPLLVDGRIVVPGAQSPDSVLATLDRAWRTRRAHPDTDPGPDAADGAGLRGG